MPKKKHKPEEIVAKLRQATPAGRSWHEAEIKLRSLFCRYEG
ncbi:MAG: hypothetical protein WCG92_23695 [Hyphomicrobiales bacterium]|nr:hypothetical protein [Alphaproteobacteria bacterium]